MSDGTFYVWVLNYGGMTVSETEQPVALEDENAKLQKVDSRTDAEFGSHEGSIFKNVPGHRNLCVFIRFDVLL